eukprot:1359452-Amorphochlora_amoeboformis.AAC.1
MSPLVGMYFTHILWLSSVMGHEHVNKSSEPTTFAGVREDPALSLSLQIQRIARPFLKARFEGLNTSGPPFSDVFPLASFDHQARSDPSEIVTI